MRKMKALLRKMLPHRYYVNVIRLRGLARYEVCAELHRTKAAAIKKAMSFGDARSFTWVAAVPVWTWVEMEESE